MKFPRAGSAIRTAATCIVLAVCLHVAAHAARQPSPRPQRLITTDDLIAVRDIDTLAVSPDGTRVAFVSRSEENQPVLAICALLLILVFAAGSQIA